MAQLLHDLVLDAARRNASAPALTLNGRHTTYGMLAGAVERVAAGLAALDAPRGARIAFFLDKRIETVVIAFAAARAGMAFVPVNPVLKPAQVGHILRDCNVALLVTTAERAQLLDAELAACPDLRHVVIAGADAEADVDAPTCAGGKPVLKWAELAIAQAGAGHRVVDVDMAAILYTSGSTGKPKGVVLSHRNLVAGAVSVASYLENSPDDTILSALPLSFDAGFSQLTTAFHAGARVVLLNYLLPRDVLRTLDAERVTGLTGVPPLWIQLSDLDWPPGIANHLRYIANTGGRMPRETLEKLRARLPRTRPFLMYGLTEAFRSTFLPPSEVDRRPDSIGKAIPNAEVLVLRPDGTPCAPNEPGELVHRGALVAMGYWNDSEKTAERYKPLPVGVGGREAGMMIPEIAVFSGDTVRMDEEGFLYFIGRADQMIKTSGYRVSPGEVEEALYSSGLVGEACAFGVPHEVLGQAIVAIVTPRHAETLDTGAVISACRERLPAFMVPSRVEVREGPLPRNPNGKIDAQALRGALEAVMVSSR